MNNPLINILIRVSRPDLFARCMRTVNDQDYPNINVIIHNEADGKEDRSQPFYWNLYCNMLKEQVKDGYFLFADDDDALASPTAISDMVGYLWDEPDGLIVQFLRNGKPKPSDALIKAQSIELGRVGGGCLVLAAKHKNIADWQARRSADYFYIKEVAAKVKLKFVPFILQVTFNNGLFGEAQDRAAWSMDLK